LEEHEVREIMQGKTMKSLLKTLGLQVAGSSAPTEAAPAKVKGSGREGARSAMRIFLNS